MSSEIATTGEPSRFLNGEGCQDRAGQSRKDIGPQSLMCDQRAGGVSGGGGSGRRVRLSGEISTGGQRSNVRHNSVNAEEAEAARREVGSVRSSDEGCNEAGAKGPNLVGVNSEATDEAMAPSMGILTPLKVQALQRTLCRSAKRATSIAPAVNDHGKPDAGNPPVRFDEGESCAVGYRSAALSTLLNQVSR